METLVAAADGLPFHHIECLSSRDFVSESRPYHRHCNCRLHDKSRRDYCPHVSPVPKVKYPLRRAWSEGSLALVASANTSPSSSPAPQPGKMNLAMCHQDYMIR